MEPKNNPLLGKTVTQANSVKRKLINDTDIDFNKLKKLENLADGPKFLLMIRNDEGKDMSKVSAFLISNVIKSVAGEIKSHSRLSDGTVLIQTHTLKQAKQLITLTRLDSSTNITIKEHSRLNQSKGFVLCREFKILSDEEIIKELSSQHVIAIKRNKRKNEKGEEYETGAYVITFSTTNTPQFIYVAWERIIVRDFVPAPLRCFICLKLGHHTSICEKEEKQKKCFNCGDNIHNVTGERCDLPPKCVNCDGDHQSTYKKCPKYEKEQTIQKIRVQEKVGFKEAAYIYNQRHPTQHNVSYANIIKNSKKPCGCQCNCDKTTINPNDIMVATTTTTTKITDIPQKVQKPTNKTNTTKVDKESDKDHDSEREMWNEIKRRELKKSESESKKRKTVVSKNGTKKLTMIKTTTNNNPTNNKNETENMECSDCSENSESTNYEYECQ